MTDLPARLRSAARSFRAGANAHMLIEAADRIEELEAEMVGLRLVIADLRDQLEPMQDW